MGTDVEVASKKNATDAHIILSEGASLYITDAI